MSGTRTGALCQGLGFGSVVDSAPCSIRLRGKGSRDNFFRLQQEIEARASAVAEWVRLPFIDQRAANETRPNGLEAGQARRKLNGGRKTPGYCHRSPLGDAVHRVTSIRIRSSPSESRCANSAARRWNS